MSRKPATRYAWTGHADGRRGTRRNNAWTCEQLPGVIVQHCGHPTAIRPYYVAGPGLAIARKFSLLVDAQLAAEAAALERDPQLPAPARERQLVGVLVGVAGDGGEIWNWRARRG